VAGFVRSKEEAGRKMAGRGTPRKDAKAKLLKDSNGKAILINQREQTQDNPIEVKVPTGSRVSLADIKAKIKESAGINTSNVCASNIFIVPINAGGSNMADGTGVNKSDFARFQEIVMKRLD
jgi:hypothetical protein